MTVVRSITVKKGESLPLSKHGYVSMMEQTGENTGHPMINSLKIITSDVGRLHLVSCRYSGFHPSVGTESRYVINCLEWSMSEYTTD